MSSTISAHPPLLYFSSFIHNMASLREQKEEFQSGHTGSSPLEINLILLAPVALLACFRVISRMIQTHENSANVVNVEVWACTAALPAALLLTDAPASWGLCALGGVCSLLVAWVFLPPTRVTTLQGALG
jgi:hypothetical protein